ncbi:MAG: 2-oxoacid ferredoxin oxidoreductase [Candidatus Moraniibacteriota bacterium]|nr:MAG: 2-oxoacid ferredoxin oxidoreductase [Candidatus Moranbacteria bacterium]
MEVGISSKSFDMPAETDIAWCPGCGNFPLLTIMKMALAELEIAPEKLVTVSGIGQAAKAPHYFKGNVFNGLHGRAFSPATAIKVANPELTVIVETGDGDAYGEGGNHFTHTIRRNPNITALIHNNMVYGLTKGQASPTSEVGMKTPVQVAGVILEPFNPIASAIALDCSFVARAFVGNVPQAKEIIKKAILHKGFALVDIFQPCTVFNKINTYQWFKEKTYELEKTHDTRDRIEAFRRAIETDRLPLGVFYENPDRRIFEDQLASHGKVHYKHQVNADKFRELIRSKV